MKIFRLVAFAFCFLAATTAAAKTPVVQQEGSLRYVSGGIGIDERDELDKIAPEFDIKVTLSTASGYLLGGGRIKIKDSEGNLLLDTTTDGPVFMLDAPAGTYIIEAVVDGRSQGMRFEAGDTAAPQSAYLTWQIDEA